MWAGASTIILVLSIPLHKLRANLASSFESQWEVQESDLFHIPHYDHAN